MIEDARFDSEINAEMCKEEEQTLKRSADDGDLADDVFSVSNGAAAASTSVRTCVIVLAARDAATLSRLFKVFEVVM